MNNKIDVAAVAAEKLAKIYKTKDEMKAPVEGGYYAMALPVEDSGIFRQGWLPDELSALTIIYKQQSDIESGTLAVVAIVGSEKALLKRVYKNSNGYVLEAPKNLDKPNEHIPPIVLTAKEASERLTILGKVVQFSIAFK